MATAKKKPSKKRATKRTPKAKTDDQLSDQQDTFEDCTSKVTAPNTERGNQELIAIDGEMVPARLMENPEFAKYAIAKRVAHTLSTSALVPEAYRGRAADCFIAIQMGAEVGLGPFQAVQSIAVIGGKPCIWGDALIGVVRASPHCEWIDEAFDKDTQTATCTAKRRGDPKPQSRSFSMQDAVTAGIANKDIWKKYGARMLQMRARAFCLRDLFPDVLKGLSVAEEVADYHTSPAPIERYTLPESPKAQPVDRPVEMPTNGAQPTSNATEPPSDDKITLEQVKTLIHNATNMEFLLKAGEAAKLLTDDYDIRQARYAYQQKKNLLINFGSGITDPAQGQPATPGEN